MIEIIQRYILPAAYEALPPAMASPQATALLLAIGNQESLFLHRHQVAGPARSFWMFEAAGIRGVLTHEASAGPIRNALQRLGYREPYESATLHAAIEHNDVLAAAFARCLLWTLPEPLPDAINADLGWRTYVAAWNPGRPRHATWATNYSSGWDRVLTALKA